MKIQADSGESYVGNVPVVVLTSESNEELEKLMVVANFLGDFGVPVKASGTNGHIALSIPSNVNAHLAGTLRSACSGTMAKYEAAMWRSNQDRSRLEFDRDMAIRQFGLGHLAQR